MTEYTIGAELPDRTFTWTNDDGSVIFDFSTGWTFTLKIGVPGETAVLTKTSGITGAAGSPNVTIVWAAGEFDNIPRGSYLLQIFARQTSSGKDRVLKDPFRLVPAVA